MPKVSIVIPIYNNEKYITRCLDSLLAQTLKDIQVLMDMQRRFGDIRLSYNFFCEELENALNYVFGMGPSLQELSEDIPDEGLLIRKTVVAVSHKIYLDTYLRLLSEELPGN